MNENKNGFYSIQFHRMDDETRKIIIFRVKQKNYEAEPEPRKGQGYIYTNCPFHIISYIANEELQWKPKYYKKHYVENPQEQITLTKQEIKEKQLLLF